MTFQRSAGGASTVRAVVGLLAVGVLLPLGAGSAEARPDTRDMSCAQAAALVRREGAVVLSTSSTTFDRYVRDVSFCSGGEVLRPEWVATRDAPQCYIGYTCYTPSRDRFGDW